MMVESAQEINHQITIKIIIKNIFKNLIFYEVRRKSVLEKEKKNFNSKKLLIKLICKW